MSFSKSVFAIIFLRLIVLFHFINLINCEDYAAIKDAGIDHFENGRWDAAIECFTELIKAERFEQTALKYRAAARRKIDPQSERAAADEKLQKILEMRGGSDC